MDYVRGAFAGRHGKGRLFAVLMGVMGFDYADRTLIGAMGPSLKSAFHLSNVGLGLTVTAVTVVGALATVPIGVLADRTNRIRILTVSMLLWSASMVVVGSSVSFTMLFTSRLALGVVTASAGPTIPSLIGDAVPPDERSTAMGRVDSGQLLGTGAAYVIAALATGYLTFRWGFWILAAGGVILGVLMVGTAEPARTTGAGPRARFDRGETTRQDRVQALVSGQGIEPHEKTTIRQNAEDMSLAEAVRYTFRVRTNVVVIIGRSIADYFFAGLATFAVIFATEQYRISEQVADMTILVLGAGAVAGVVLMGRLADRLLEAGYLNARLWVGAAGLAGGALFLTPALFTRSVGLALPEVAAAAFLVTGSGPVLDALRIDVLAPRLRGRGESIREVFRTIAEGGAPFLFGFLSGLLAGGGQAGLRMAFLVTMPALVLAAVIIVGLGRQTYGRDVASALASSGA